MPLNQELVTLLQNVTLPIAAMIAVVVLYRDSQSRTHDLIDANAAQVADLVATIKILRDRIDALLAAVKLP